MEPNKARTDFINMLQAGLKGEREIKRYEDTAYHLVSVTDDKGDLWYGSCENCTRRWLRDVGQQVEAQMVEIRPEDGMNIPFGSGQEGARSWTFINTAGVATISNYPILLMTAAQADDRDVSAAVAVMGKELEIVGDLNLAEPISFEEYFMYLYNSRRKDGGNDNDDDEVVEVTTGEAGAAPVLYDAESQSGMIVTRVSVGHSPFVGRYLAITGEQVVVYERGEVARVRSSRFLIDSGRRAMVSTMPLSPLSDERKQELESRGRIAVNSFGHRQYKGMAYTPGFFGDAEEHTVSSRVVFDPAGLRMINANQYCNLLKLFNMELQEKQDAFCGTKSKTSFVPQDDDYVLVNQYTPFYNLHANRWMMGRIVTDTSDVQYRADSFERLVLSDDRKRLLRAITNNLYRGNVDVIDGKGGGAIFLLDGAPGTGKTLTAEATAESLQRILYKVSLGELGTDVSRLEQTLNRILTVAARWDAILLIDEADVFLEKRTAENIHRNALVAVFLRLLEYYEGVLFLTTNRGDNIDAALMSRVTLGLHYTAPTNDGMKQIWTNLLNNAEIPFNDIDLDLLIGFNVNGREIKNSINSARALAMNDNVSPTVAHVAEILRVQRSFFDDLKRNSGKARSY